MRKFIEFSASQILREIDVRTLKKKKKEKEKPTNQGPIIEFRYYLTLFMVKISKQSKFRVSQTAKMAIFQILNL